MMRCCCLMYELRSEWRVVTDVPRLVCMKHLHNIFYFIGWQKLSVHVCICLCIRNGFNVKEMETMVSIYHIFILLLLGKSTLRVSSESPEASKHTALRDRLLILIHRWCQWTQFNIPVYQLGSNGKSLELKWEQLRRLVCFFNSRVLQDMIFISQVQFVVTKWF